MFCRTNIARREEQLGTIFADEVASEMQRAPGLLHRLIEHLVVVVNRRSRVCSDQQAIARVSSRKQTQSPALP